jgi:AraC family transcriptional regulator
MNNRAQSESGGSADPASGERHDWLGNSLWQVPELEISKIKPLGSIMVVKYHRGDGEAIWRGNRPRLVLAPDQIPPRLIQVEQGPTQQISAAAPGGLSFCPAGLTLRTVQPAARFVKVVWDADLYSALLPELGAAASEFEYLHGMIDPLLSQIVATLAQEIDGGFADRILVESLGTALYIRIARRFVEHLPLPTSNKGLSPERLQRVHEFVEANLDEELSLTILADIACLSPYHFSRSFKEAAGVGPQRYVMQRRLDRAKTLL